MEINDLQITAFDNQPLTQAMLEINDLREFVSRSPYLRSGRLKHQIRRELGGLNSAKSAVAALFWLAKGL
jgi:hypothetical protein